MHPEGDKVKFLAVNYIIAISKLDPVWLSYLWGGRLFSGGKLTEHSGWEGWPLWRFFPPPTQTLGELKFCKTDAPAYPLTGSDCKCCELQYYLRRRREISPLASFETFSQRRVQRIGAGYLHINCEWSYSRHVQTIPQGCRCGCRFSFQPSSSTPDLTHLINWSQSSESWLVKLCSWLVGIQTCSHTALYGIV